MDFIKERLKVFPITPEAIFIHVPKTAGSTFHSVLKDSYGWRLKHIHRREDTHIWNNGLEFKSNKPFVKAVYGHIEAHPKWLDYYPKAKLITWVRDPVERVISAYYHWMKEGKNIDERKRQFLEDKPDLVEFVESEKYKLTVNAYATFLGRIDLKNYFFVGRTEHFDGDLKKLENALGRKFRYTGQQANVNAKKPEIDPSIKAHIRKRLSSEYEIYETLLQQTKK